MSTLKEPVLLITFKATSQGKKHYAPGNAEYLKVNALAQNKTAKGRRNKLTAHSSITSITSKILNYVLNNCVSKSDASDIRQSGLPSSQLNFHLKKEE